MTDINERIVRLETKHDSLKEDVERVGKEVDERAPLSDLQRLEKQVAALVAKFWWALTVPALYLINQLLSLFTIGGQ